MEVMSSNNSLFLANMFSLLSTVDFFTLPCTLCNICGFSNIELTIIQPILNHNLRWKYSKISYSLYLSL